MGAVSCGVYSLAETTSVRGISNYATRNERIPEVRLAIDPYYVGGTYASDDTLNSELPLCVFSLTLALGIQSLWSEKGNNLKGSDFSSPER